MRTTDLSEIEYARLAQLTREALERLDRTLALLAGYSRMTVFASRADELERLLTYGGETTHIWGLIESLREGMFLGHMDHGYDWCWCLFEVKLEKLTYSFPRRWDVQGVDLLEHRSACQVWQRLGDPSGA